MKTRKGISEFIMILVVAVSVIFAVLATIFIRPSESPSHFGVINESTDNNSTNNRNSTFGASRETNYWNATNTSFEWISSANTSDMSFGWILNVSNPEYEPTLNMSELLYKGDKVIAVYQTEVQLSRYVRGAVPCVIIENGSRYCTR